jgi:GDP-6-deoxy-D-talose 4-dehydrogenase
MSRILITGIGGFTGRYLTEELFGSGHEPIGICGRAGETVPPSVEIHIGDLRDLPRLDQIIIESRPDKIIHLAAVSFVAHGNVEDFYLNNIVGTRNLLDAALRCGRGISHIILASSANVYGNTRGGQIDETTSPDPVNDYGISKLAMEHVAGMFSRQLPITIARPFNYTGIGQSTSMLIPKIVEHVTNRSDYIELGNVDVARDFSDVRFVADVYARMADCPATIGQTLNICSGTVHSLREILAMASEIAGHEPEIRVNPALVRTMEVNALWGSKERLEAILGPVEMPSLSETLRWMIDKG